MKAWQYVSMRTEHSDGVFWTYSNSDVYVLSKNNSLEFDDEEVDKLSQVGQNALNSLLRNGVQLLRSHLGGHALAQHNLASNLCRRSDAQHNVKGLQGISSDWDVAGHEDGEYDAGVADGGGARVLPGEQVVEKRVVVCELLAGGGLRLRRLAGGGEVGELVLGGGGLRAGLLGDRAIGDRLDGGRALDVLHRLLGGLLGVCERHDVRARIGGCLTRRCAFGRGGRLGWMILLISVSVVSGTAVFVNDCAACCLRECLDTLKQENKV